MATSNTTRTSEELEVLVRGKISYFINEILKGRYSVFVTDKFLEAWLLSSFMDEVYADKNGYLSNLAYKASVGLFEGVFEHRLRAGGNGHHVAQSFCALFPNESAYGVKIR